MTHLIVGVFDSLSADVVLAVSGLLAAAVLLKFFRRNHPSPKPDRRPEKEDQADDEPRGQQNNIRRLP